MKIIIYDENKQARLNRILEWLIYMVGYALILITLSILIESFNISNAYFGLYALLAAIIIYLLNKTIKPIMFFLTLPLTALTFGLFYPFLNVINLYIVDFILADNFDLGSIFITFIIAILISLMNTIMSNLIIKPILRRSQWNLIY